MKKLSLLFPFLKILLKRPSVITKGLYHAVVKQDRKDFVIKNFGLADGLPELDLLELFPDFNGEVNPFTHLYGTSLPIDIVILKNLAGRFDNCEYLEIGSWRGESATNLSKVCKHCVTVSLSDEEMNKFGYGKEYTRVQRFFSKGLTNVEHVEANSRNFDFHSLNRKFDLIFVDGDHSYDGVKNDTQKVFELLKDESSIIIWHDYTEQYELINWEVFAGILDGAPNEKRSKIYHITNSLCAIFVNGNFKTHKRDFPSVPDKNFTVKISGKKLPVNA